MFAYNRSALAVILPLLLLGAVVICSSLAAGTRRTAAVEPPAQTLAASLPSR